MRARDVVFVDGVRTPFGKSGPKGIYAETRADDLVVRVIRELLRRNPNLPKEQDRRGRDRGHHADRRPGADDRPQRRHPRGPAGDGARVRDRPDVRGRDDRGDDGGGRGRARRGRRRDRGRRRAHGPAPDGRGRRPQPAVRLRAHRRRVRAVHGHDRGEPARPVPGDHQGARRRLRRRQPAEGRRGLRRRARSSPTWCRWRSAPRSSAGAWRPPTSRRARRRPSRPCAA